MKIKLFQLNIFQGMHLPEIVEFVKENNFDILHFQEVSGGTFSQGGSYFVPKKYLKELSGDRLEPEPKIENVGLNCFEVIKKELLLNGILSKNAVIKESKNSYFGNATFYSKNLDVLEKKIFTIEKTVNLNSPAQLNPKTIGRSAVALKFKFSNNSIWFVNTHLLWGPNSLDDSARIKDGEKFIDFLNSLDEPFVLSGDFNLDKSSIVVKKISTMATNLSTDITNTLNPNIHAAKYLFPKGLAVDYIFTSPQIKIDNFQIVDKPNLSDHYGLSIEINI